MVKILSSLSAECKTARISVKNRNAGGFLFGRRWVADCAGENYSPSSRISFWIRLPAVRAS